MYVLRNSLKIDFIRLDLEKDACAVQRVRSRWKYHTMYWVTFFLKKKSTRQRVYTKSPFMLNDVCAYVIFPRIQYIARASKWSIIWACWFIKLVTIEKSVIKPCWCHWQSPLNLGTQHMRCVVTKKNMCVDREKKKCEGHLSSENALLKYHVRNW